MDLNKMMAKAQQMQDQLQRHMAEMRVQASAGGGTVHVTVTGTKQLIDIKIDPAAKDDFEMLQDMIVAAINDAHRKVDEALASQMQGMMGGMGLPGGS